MYITSGSTSFFLGRILNIISKQELTYHLVDCFPLASIFGCFAFVPLEQRAFVQNAYLVALNLPGTRYLLCHPVVCRRMQRASSLLSKKVINDSST